MKQRLLLIYLLLNVAIAFIAEPVKAQVSGTVIQGKVLDEDQEELPGVNVIVKERETEKTYGTITDINGDFSIPVEKSGSYEVVISYVGYQSQQQNVTVKVSQSNQLGIIRMESGSIGLDEVKVVASVATDRRTPVAVSTIKAEVIQNKIGNQEFPEILRATPSVYVTKQGGGFGDSRINVRGFDQRNTAVMINGVPVNDMENGWVYWSNWAGLSDVTSTMQVQRGLGASKLAVSSVGGSINIITNAAEMKKGATFSSSFGNDGFQKYGVVLSTGLGEKGWALTVQGSHTRGDGYADGTMFRAWSYFASVAKKFNNSHSLHLTVFGAPQWHHQRNYGSFDGVNIATIEEEGILYNPQWGYKGGDEFSWNKNFYHKPKAYINHYWDISEKTQLATSAYVSIGRGGGTGDLGQINGRFRTSSQFKNDDGTVRWDDIETWNSGQNVPDFENSVRDSEGNVIQTLGEKLPWNKGGGFDGQYVGTSGYSRDFTSGGVYTNRSEGGFIRRASMNEHNWYGVLSNLTHKINNNFTLVSGLDLRYYKGLHYRRVEDLLGLDAYFDDDDINQPEKYITSEGRADGNQIDYNNDGLVNWIGVFSQLEYSIDKLSIFGSISLSRQGFKRIDYFLYEDSDPEQESDWENFFGGTAKLGGNFNINDYHNVFVNGGYFSQQPLFDNVFVNFSNDVNEDVENQNVYALEAGYGYRSRFLSLNVNLYHTLWSNRQFSRTIDVDGTDGTANFSGVEQLHQGVELDFIASPTDKLKINGMASLGNWRYTNNFSANVFDNNRELIDELVLYTDDVKVPDAAQTTFNVGASYEIFKGFNVSASYFYADKIFADFDIANDKSILEEGNQAWELPAYGLLDAGIAYRFKLGNVDLTWTLNIYNLLDEKYISESESNILYNPENTNDKEYGRGGSVFNRVYYGFGRTWSTGLKVRL